MRTKITQVPRYNLSCTIEYPTAERVDAARVPLGMSRHRFLITCIEMALPELEAKAQQAASTPPKSAQ